MSHTRLVRFAAREHSCNGKRNFQIFEHSQIVNQAVALKHKSDVAFVQLIALLDAQLVHGLVDKAIFAGPCPIEHSNYGESNVDLPAPLGPIIVTKLPGLNIQINAAAANKEFSPRQCRKTFPNFASE